MITEQISKALKDGLTQYLSTERVEVPKEIEAFTIGIAPLVAGMNSSAAAGTLDPKSWEFLKDILAVEAAKMALEGLVAAQAKMVAVSFGIISAIVGSINPIAGVITETVLTTITKASGT